MMAQLSYLVFILLYKKYRLFNWIDLISREMVFGFFLFCIKHTKKNKYKNISILCQIKPATKWYIFSFLYILYKKEKSWCLCLQGSVWVVLKLVFVSLICFNSIKYSFTLQTKYLRNWYKLIPKRFGNCTKYWFRNYLFFDQPVDQKK